MRMRSFVWFVIILILPVNVRTSVTIGGRVDSLIRAGAPGIGASGPRTVFHAGGLRYSVVTSGCGPFILYYRDVNERLEDEIEKLLCGSLHAVASEIGLERIDTIRVFIAPGGKAYRRLHGGAVPEWGEAFSSPSRMILGINAEEILLAPRPLETVVKHELSHLCFSQRVKGTRCPVWFLEGLAMLQSREWTFRDEWQLAGSLWRKGIPYLDDLEGRFPVDRSEAAEAYRLSYAAVDMLLGGRKEEIATFSASIGELGDFDRAFLLSFGMTPDDFADEFHYALEKKYKTAGILVYLSPYWGGVVLLFLAAYLVKRIRMSRKLRELENADEI